MKYVIIAILIGAVVISGSIILSSKIKNSQLLSPNNQNISNDSNNNVIITNGKQIINIRVKGGYFPKVVSAKAGIPTVLKFNYLG